MTSEILQTCAWLSGGVCCLLIAVQDARSREISAWPLAGILLSGFLFQSGTPWQETLRSFGLNVAFVGFLLGFLVCYFRLRGKTQVIDKLIGWGDILMLVAAGSWFSFEGFLLFYAFSVLLALLASLVYLHLYRIDRKTYAVPLASYLAAGGIVGQLIGAIL